MNKIILLVLCISFVFAENSRYDEPKSDFDITVEEYMEFNNYKAMAIAMDDNGRHVYWYIHSQPFYKQAKKIALKKCNEAAKRRKVKAECKLYAIGNKILMDLDK